MNNFGICPYDDWVLGKGTFWGGFFFEGLGVGSSQVCLPFAIGSGSIRMRPEAAARSPRMKVALLLLIEAFMAKILEMIWYGDARQQPVCLDI